VSTGASVLELYNTCRKEAADLARLRNQCFEQAALASAAGDGLSAKTYGRKGRDYNEQMKEKHRLAADAIFAERNPHGFESGQVDLHGLHRAEALERLEWVLQQAPDGTVLRVLTGSGHHSRGIHNAPRLRPAVEEYLANGRFRYRALPDSNKHVGAFQVRM